MSERTIFVGDIHGCAAEFEQLLDRVGYRKGRDRLLLAGDAFTRGPDPLHVWQLICDTGADMVLGNHDDRQLHQLRDHASGTPPRFKHPDQSATFDKLRSVAAALRDWLEARPLVMDEVGFLLVHAGIHPVDGVTGTSRDQFLSIRTWPPVGGIDGPRWHDVISENPAAWEPNSERPIVFGHDAPGGLVVRRNEGTGRPWLVGLDSGCIYGGALTAWILEEDRLVDVPSRQGDGRRWY